MYMIVLQDQYRKSSISLDFGPGERLYNFVMKLRDNIKGDGGAAPPAAAIHQDQDKGSASSWSVVTSSNAKPKLSCSYCLRDGHTIYDCRKIRKKTEGLECQGGTRGSGNPARKGRALIGGEAATFK